MQFLAPALLLVQRELCPMLCNVVINLPVCEMSIQSFLLMALVFNLGYKWNYLGSFKIDFSSTLQGFWCN